MERPQDRKFLDAAVRLRLLARDDAARILEERAATEAFLARDVPAAHTVHQRQWLTPAQIAQVRTSVRRHEMLCPGCWSRVDVFPHPAAPGACPSCTAAYAVPADPEAEVLASPAAAHAPPAPAPPAPVNDPRADELARHRDALEYLGFQVIRRAGSGGMGVVYQAIQQPLNRPVALKVMQPGLSIHSPAIRRFFREAETAARLRHPNLAAIHHAGFCQGFYFLALEWMEGGDLAARLRAHGPIPLADALRWSADMARGLSAIHAAGMVYRDLKPANVLLRADGTACLADFGLMRAVNPLAHLKITEPGEILGTLQYMSPEQYRNSATCGPATDLYALGATLYHLLAGRPPLADEKMLDAERKLLAGDLPPLGAAAPGTPPEVARLVHRLLAREATDRPASATVALDELERLPR